MTPHLVAMIVAIALISLGVLLIGIGTRPRPAPTRVPSAETGPPVPVGEAVPELAGLAGPADPPEDVEDSAPPLVVVESRPFRPLVPAGHQSTPEERRICRDQLSPELGADLSEVIKLIESRPAELRGLLLNTSTAVVSQELSVLRAYLRGSLTGLDARLRNGPLREEDPATVACLVSALGRLPAHHGAVFHRAPRGDIALDAFFPGSILVEPAFTRAERNAFPAGSIDTDQLVNYVIWSESGRHTPLLVGHTETVLFTAAVRFRVLALDQQPGSITVFLAEESDRPAGRGRREHQVLEHLRSRAATAGVGPIDGPAPSPVPHPGLDETGRPYTPATTEGDLPTCPVPA
jgi:hypothetical protein